MVMSMAARLAAAPWPALLHSWSVWLPVPEHRVRRLAPL